MSKFLLGINKQNIADQIAALINVGGQLYRAVHSQSILNGSITYIIEMHCDTIIGTIGLEVQTPLITELKHLVVHKNYRRQGIGKRLLEKGIAFTNTEYVYGLVRSNNLTNIRNNLRVGMLPLGIKKGYGNYNLIVFGRRVYNNEAFANR